MDQTDVKSVYVSSTGLAGVGGTAPNLGVRLKAVWINSPATAGNLTITDGTSAGTTRLKMDTDAIASNDYLWMPGEGIRFVNDMYITLTNITSVTLFYG